MPTIVSSLDGSAGGAMELAELKKRLQGFLGDGLVLVIGSGLSCAEGIPGMAALGKYLAVQLPPTLSPDDNALWKKVHPALESEGLEAALLKYPPTSSLEALIVQSTGAFIAAAEAEIITDVFANGRELRLTSLIPHLLKPNGGLPIVTTNYDRLVELACEEAGLGVDTMFSGSVIARLNPTESFWSFCRGAELSGRHVRHRFAAKANVFKPHGSLDWYYREGGPVRFSGALPLSRLIITPGLNKFRSGYESPFDKHREEANDAIDKAQSFLIVGYGFNDDHLETHLVPRIRSGAKTIVLTYELSEKARGIALSNKNVVAAEYYRSDDAVGTRFVVDGQQMTVSDVNFWDLGGFVKGVLSV